MNYAFKILINYNNLIPENLLGDSGFLKIKDVYQFSITSKFIRTLIESFSKNKVDNFDPKYKTYFNNLIFNRCKLPKIVLKYVRFENTHYCSFIDLYSKIKINLNDKSIKPRIKYDEDSKRIYFEKEFTQFKNFNEAFEFLTNKGFYPIDYKNLCNEIIHKTCKRSILVDSRFIDYKDQLEQIYDKGSTDKRIAKLEENFKEVGRIFQGFPHIWNCNDILQEYHALTSLESLNKNNYKNYDLELFEILDFPVLYDYHQLMILMIIEFCDIFEVERNLNSFFNLLDNRLTIEYGEIKMFF